MNGGRESFPERGGGGDECGGQRHLAARFPMGLPTSRPQPFVSGRCETIMPETIPRGVTTMNMDTIREWLRKQPFEPFELHMSNGEVFRVGHPELSCWARRNSS